MPQIVHLIRERRTAGISVLAFSVWCLASLLFLIHASIIGDAVFISLQAVNFVAGGVIVWLSNRYEGEGCPFHRQVYGKGESMV